MGRRNGQNRKNPPQIKVFAEGQTEIIYLRAPLKTPQKTYKMR